MATNPHNRMVNIPILKIDGSNFDDWFANIRRCFEGTCYWPILTGEEGRPNEPQRDAKETVVEHNTRRYAFHTWHQQSARACDVLLTTVDPALWILFNKSMTCKDVLNIIRLRCNPEEKKRRRIAWTSITWNDQDLETFWDKWSAACNDYVDTGPGLEQQETASQFLAAISPAAAKYEHIRTWKAVIEVSLITATQNDPDPKDLLVSLLRCVRAEEKRQAEEQRQGKP